MRGSPQIRTALDTKVHDGLHVATATWRKIVLKKVVNGVTTLSNEKHDAVRERLPAG